MTRTAALAIAASAGLAAASTQTSTQVVPFDYGLNDASTNPVFQKFDTMGGTRELLGVTLSYDQQISFDVDVEQNSPIAIAQGNFFADILYRSLHQLGIDDGGGDDEEGEGEGEDGRRNIPFLGPGAAGLIVSPGLAPTDGLNGSGSDFFTTSYSSGFFNFTSINTAASQQSVLDAFTGTGDLTTVLTGLTEIFGGYDTDPGFPALDPNNPPQMPADFPPFFDPFYGVFVNVNNLRHQGTITATYEFRVIPTPATAALLVAGALVGCRRRR